MRHSVNLAIQVLPLHMSEQEAHRIIDAAIAVIQQSGMKYIVTPFETVIEGAYDKIMLLLDDIQQACYKEGAISLLINMKLHRNATRDLTIDDKIGKYRE